MHRPIERKVGIVGDRHRLQSVDDGDDSTIGSNFPRTITTTDGTPPAVWVRRTCGHVVRKESRADWDLSSFVHARERLITDFESVCDGVASCGVEQVDLLTVEDYLDGVARFDVGVGSTAMSSW